MRAFSDHHRILSYLYHCLFVSFSGRMAQGVALLLDWSADDGDIGVQILVMAAEGIVKIISASPGDTLHHATGSYHTLKVTRLTIPTFRATHELHL
uniref:Uncharacterized protein n=1 Tax=Timema cristinae TaxID=61476 RepID=A0A7R9DEP6_TIMCR|nr:unnamed protein product [Timema cristinae]